MNLRLVPRSTLSVRLLPRASLQARVLPVFQFPSQVVAAAGVNIVQAAGVYTFGLDFADLPGNAVIPDKAASVFAFFDPLTGTFFKITYNDLIASIDLSLDPTLQAIAALAPVADQGIYFTGADVAAVYALTSSGRALSALVGAADQMPYFNGAGSAAVTALTAFARTLLGSANAPAALTTLGAVPLAGGTMSGLLLLSADPVAALGAATKQYVDGVAQGLSVKSPVLCATTANIALTGEQTIDGVLTAASRVLVKNQATASQNGIYVSAAGAWARSIDMNVWTEVPSAFVFVEQGTTNADTGWTCISDPGGTLNTTAINWVQFSGAGTYTAGTGLQLSGTQFSASAKLQALNALAATANRLIGQDGSGNPTLVTMPAAGLTLAAGALALANSLSAIQALATTGIMRRTGVDAFSAGTTVAVNEGGTGQVTLTAHGVLVGEGTAGIAATSAGTAGQVLKSAGAAADPVFADELAAIEFVIDGAGSTITTGLKGYLEVPFACTITQATLLAAQSGSIVVDVFKCTYAQFDASSTHPVSADKITASAPPTISAATKAQDATLTGWTTALAAGDILAFNVNSATTITRVTISLKVKKS